jgi:5-methylcytosine-specific restriction protein B
MLADEIRKFVFEEYIEPARREGRDIVTIRAGDVHDKMDLSGRMPAVCGAIGTRKFENLYNVRQIKREGPTQGANVFFTFKI